MKICLKVIIENREKEAFVTSHLEEQIWIVTGKGNDFQYFPISAVFLATWTKIRYIFTLETPWSDCRYDDEL